MTPKEVMDLISPPQAVMDKVSAFFTQFDGVSVLELGDALKIEATTAAVEDIFNTRVHEFEHINKGYRAFRQLGGATIPKEISEHVDIVTGLTAFPIYPDKLDTSKKVDAPDAEYGSVVTSTVRSLYGIPPHLAAKNDKTAQCILEFLPVEGPLFTDMATYAKEADEVFTNFTTIVGKYQQGGFDGESTLDIEIVMGLGSKVKNWYWSIEDGWLYEAALEIFNHDSRPQVVSVSYGWPEVATCQASVTHAKCDNGDVKAYIARANTEIQKVSATGVSWIVASGDQGAAGNLNTGCQNTTHPVFGIYPAGSNWVTTTSATTVIGAGTTTTPSICNAYPCTTAKLEHPCMFNNTLYRWTTGGGFSEITATPSWQQAAVAKYTSSNAILPPNQYWSKTNRGYPDISATGSRILIIQNGRASQSAGTSASTPTIAAIVSLLNDARMEAGKQPLGFLNQVLYKMGEDQSKYFTDITAGDNTCTQGRCCQYGYGAVEGWDAVSGWGSPKFAAMKEYVMNLP
mmetsp:Transcript_30232/g.33785  ORF Transcript_30232/g.33785 Transcript_30232/m.33785 type:complete len:515 (-) Transcript_30232:53-1597(-)